MVKILEDKVTTTILTPTQERFLEAFYENEKHKPERFYLSGGTALAEYYLQHRRSDDLDFFTRARESFLAVNERVRTAVRAADLEIRDVDIAEYSLRYRLTGDAERDHTLEKVEFLFDRDPYFGEPRYFDRVYVDAELAIAVNKVLTVAQRTERKDYVDLFMLVSRSGYRIENLLPLAKQKNGISELGIAAKFDQVDELMPMESFERSYMVVDMRSEDLIAFYKEQARRLFELFPPKKT